MIALAFTGAGVGLGIWLVSLAVRARPTLADVADRLDVPGRSSVAAPTSGPGQLERWFVDRCTFLLESAGMDPRRRASDLRVTQRTVEQHVLAKLVWAVGLGTFGMMVGLLLAPVSGALGFVLVGAIGAALGFYLPETFLTSRAAEARRAFRHAYGGYLDLVNVMLAAGAGPESALQTAAESGAGWAFAEIRGALSSARRTRVSVADAFSSLGAELGVTELEELAASMALVGNQGARVRSTLGTKAHALRAQQMAETEAEAEAATERMTVPVALLLLGFLMLLAYPAVMLIREAGAG